MSSEPLTLDILRAKTKKNLEGIRKKLALVAEKLSSSSHEVSIDKRVVYLGFSLLEQAYKGNEPPENSVTGDLYWDVLETCLNFHSEWKLIDKRDDSSLSRICDLYLQNVDESIQPAANSIIGKLEDWDAKAKSAIYAGISAMIILSLKYAYLRCVPTSVDTSGSYPVYSFEKNLYPELDLSGELARRKVTNLPCP